MSWLTNLRQPNKRRSTRTDGDPSGDRGTVQRGRAHPGATTDRDALQTNPAISGRNRFRAAYAMKRNAPIVSGFWGVARGLSAQAVFNIDAEDERIDYVFASLVDSWPQTLIDLAESLLIGMSVTEWSTRRDMAGRYSLQTLTRLPPGSFFEYELDGVGRIDVFKQIAGGRILEIPRWKTMFVTEGTGLEGEGAVTNVAEDALITINHRRNLHHAIDANLAQLRDYFVHSDEDVEKARKDDPIWQSVLDIIKNKKRNARIAFPSEVQVVDDGSGGDRLSPVRMYDVRDVPPVPIADNDKMMELQKLMAIALNVQLLLLGQDGTGSLALARIESQILHTRIDGTLTLVAREVARMLAFFWSANGWGEPPNVTVDTSGWRDPNDLADVLQKIKDVPLDRYSAAVNDVLKQIGLPLIDDEKKGGKVPDAGDGDADADANDSGDSQ